MIPIPRPYRPSGPLALEPAAWGMLWAPPAPPAVELRGGVAVVSVRGPLVHHEDPWCDSYDAIKCRVLEALEGKPKAVVLSVDSPGGLVSGLFDTAREISAACEAAGVRLVGYVDGAALSAAYALVATCSRVYAPPTASVGSIGVVAQLLDATAQDKQFGLAFRFAFSGERKVDGNPHAGISNAALAAQQRQVDYLAGLFFEHVAAHRAPTADEVQRLQAATLIGEQALRAGLVDELAGLDEVIAAVAAEETTPMEPKDPKKPAPAPAAAPAAVAAPPAATAGTKAEEKEYEEAIAALRRRATAGDARAKRMLKAELDDGGDEKPKDDGAGADPKPAPEPDDDDKPKDEGAAKALAARVEAIEAKQTAEAKDAEVRERAQLLASRADLDEPTRKLLAAAPIADVRAWAATAPRRTVKPVAGAPSFTRPEGAGGAGHVDHLPPDEAHALDVQMGLATATAPPFVDGTRQVLPVMTRSAARAEIAKREASAKGGAAK